MIDTNTRFLVTGASGFLGSRISQKLSEYQFSNIAGLVRSTDNINVNPPYNMIQGNLINQSDAERIVKDVEVIIHCAAGKQGPIASMFSNTVVATRNLLEAIVNSKSLKRFVHVSSFSVYRSALMKRNQIIDENSPLETNLHKRNDGYAYVKLKQESLVRQYADKFSIPTVIVRPGVIYGPGGDELSRRIGVGLLGFFMNIGKRNMLPLSYVDNCADAIIKAATVTGIEGEIINIHDNDLRTCDQFLSGYKTEVKNIPTIRVPYPFFWLFSWFIESYSQFSGGQIPPIFNRYKTASTWGKRQFDNRKLRNILAWSPKISTDDGLQRHFRYFQSRQTN